VLARAGGRRSRAALTRRASLCELNPSVQENSVTRSEIWRLEKYLRNLFRLDTITIV